MNMHGVLTTTFYPGLDIITLDAYVYGHYNTADTVYCRYECVFNVYDYVHDEYGGLPPGMPSSTVARTMRDELGRMFVF